MELVFDIISAESYTGTRHLIKQLEAARAGDWKPPQNSMGEGKCVKCGHNCVESTDGFCLEHLLADGGVYATLCGCKCDFSNEGD